jgi:S-adenosylmethionine:tRNA ribosyltransferase-isomerase
MNTATRLQFITKESPIIFQSPVVGQKLAGWNGGPLDFSLPSDLEAGEPPEARGLARDQVRLLVSHYLDNRLTHTQFRSLPAYLEPGDLLVINTSGTLNAALKATRADGTPLELHLSTRLPADLWVVEMRQRDAQKTRPFFEAIAGETFTLPGGATATLLAPYLAHHREENDIPVRLWIATFRLPYQLTLNAYLAKHGFPIRYSYVKEAWPLEYYQTVYTTEPGSAEMPSAGRAFTPELITQLVARGVRVAPLLLHTGVASLEEHEPPYEEYYRVPFETAQLVNATRAAGRRVIAVGTTAVRALETVTGANDVTHPGQGWTDVVITPQRGLRAVNAMLTGLHEPQATHLAMLEALAGAEHVQLAYAAALEQRYLWHEFGDLHLILP